MTRNDVQSELTDLFGTRTELECVIEDLRSAGDLAGGKRAGLEAEIAKLTRQISAKERELQTLLPDWEAQRSKESTERRKLDHAEVKLKAAFSRQARATRFKSRAERDQCLRHEIASIETYQATQTSALQAAKEELNISHRSQKEIEEKILGIRGRIEDGRTKMKGLSNQATTLRDQHAGLAEKRKELWREDTKLDTLLKQASEQSKRAESALATLMDKVDLPICHAIALFSSSFFKGHRAWSPCCG